MHMPSTKQKIAIGYFILAFLGLVLMQTVFFTPQSENLSYRDFKTLLKAGKVIDLLLWERTITGRLSTDGLEGLLPPAKIEELRTSGRGEPRFVTVQVDDPTLIPDLEAAGVQFQGRIESRWLGTLLSWIVPALVFVAIWGLFMRRMGTASGLMTIGKSKAKVYVEQATGVTFDDVAGMDEARAELVEIVDFLKRPEHYRRLGGKIPKGVLLVGAPGTGKTLLAKAVAGEAGVPFFSLSGADFVEMFVGVGAARVRDLFAQAQATAPSIIFIDELDALGKARGVSPMMGGHDEREQTLNQLLAEMDGFDTQKGVILLAATNRPEILDPALLRPGRFDRQVVLDRPDLKGRAKILRVHTRQVTLAPAVDLEQIAPTPQGSWGPTSPTSSTRPPSAPHARRRTRSRWSTSRRPSTGWSPASSANPASSTRKKRPSSRITKPAMPWWRKHAPTPTAWPRSPSSRVAWRRWGIPSNSRPKIGT